jgi:protein SCO1
MLGGMLRILVVALVLLVAAMLLMPRPGGPPPEPENATVLPTPRPLPAFALQDHTGESFSKQDLLGRFSLMFFGFTNCPDVCPITLQILAATKSRLDSMTPDRVPAVVFVSVDPYRDSPERIERYLAGFDPSFTGVTASDEALAPLLQALSVTVQKHEHEGEQYNVVHNGQVYFIGPQGDWLGISSPPHDPATLAADFLKIREWYESRPDPAPGSQGSAAGQGAAGPNRQDAAPAEPAAAADHH